MRRIAESEFREVLLSKIIEEERGYTSPCWIWQASVFPDGYGYQRATIRGRPPAGYRAHRLAAMVWLGFDVLSEMLVCHHCDVALCINPEHLFVGTQRENMLDMHAKGREYRMSGSRHFAAKLTETQVVEIRLLYSEGVKQINIAERFGVTQGTISDIVLRRRWKHV